ncbi:hypothetical protein [Anaeromyxobacter oryzisoli]|jgi:hypothetical protein|uniref:hypothetical protein n=1 Tax=Anaeromyxobacter oryzisoli TaxID=2925408 RepID=UPI001F5855ED|nr:hypothetical protein [Anaeromyxobacter sp. SG63]
MFFEAVAGLFAVYMLVRHVPRAAAALRGGAPGGRAAATVAILNVALALAILVVSVKGLAGGLIRR